MLDAAKSVGASTILHLSPGAPVFPGKDSPSTGADEFGFGDLHIKIVNYEEDYKYPGAVADANLFAWGVEVTSHGHTAFLSADIEETDGDETRLVDSGVLGHVDVLKLGHHGAATSNSAHYPVTTLCVRDGNEPSHSSGDCQADRRSRYALVYGGRGACGGC